MASLSYISRLRYANLSLINYPILDSEQAIEAATKCSATSVYFVIEECRSKSKQTLQMSHYT